MQSSVICVIVIMVLLVDSCGSIFFCLALYLSTGSCRIMVLVVVFWEVCHGLVMCPWTYCCRQTLVAQVSDP